MGAFLATPNTEKISIDEDHEKVSFGVSGMQGWRMSMEDAHCCLPDIDGNKTGLFGVFDGHGGKEVAEYVSQNIARFLLDTESFQKGNYRDALKEAFMTLDEAITTPEVIEELKKIAGSDADEDDEDEAAMLMEESTMPIEELLKRIKKGAQEHLDEKERLKGEEEDEEKKENMTNGHTENGTNSHNGSSSTGSSRSRKQRAPVKRDESSGGSSSSSAEPSSSSSCQQEEGGSSSSSKDEAASSNGETSESSKPDEKSTTEEKEPMKVSVLDIDSADSDSDDSDDDEEEEGEGEEDYEEDGEFEDADGMDFQAGSDEVGKDSGTTAVVALMKGDKLYVANAGDSRCVLCRGGKSLDLSVDHKPEDDIERKRIENAGAKIEGDGRVNGGLNLSRAIGDHAYKTNKDMLPEEQAITALPDITEHTITKEDTFMVLACDGIWNVMESEEVIEFVHSRLSAQPESKEELKLSKICEELFENCLAPNTENDGTGCDNMTCCIVKFNHDNITTVGGTKRQASPDAGQSKKKQKTT